MRSALRLLCMLAFAGTLLSLVTGAIAENVKYYRVEQQVTSLTTVASRFLGDPGRAGEIFNLNAGRRQPDGDTLTDANRLVSGWLLVLPWDAVGDGVQFGPLPTRYRISSRL